METNEASTRAIEEKVTSSLSEETEQKVLQVMKRVDANKAEMNEEVLALKVISHPTSTYTYYWTSS